MSARVAESSIEARSHAFWQLAQSVKGGCMRCALLGLTMRMNRFPQTFFMLGRRKRRPEVCIFQRLMETPGTVKNCFKALNSCST